MKNRCRVVFLALGASLLSCTGPHPRGLPQNHTDTRPHSEPPPPLTLETSVSKGIYAALLLPSSSFLWGTVSNGVFVADDPQRDHMPDEEFRRVLLHGNFGTARQYNWGPPSSILLLSSNKVPQLYLVLPNFTVPSAVKPYVFIVTNDVVVPVRPQEQYSRGYYHLLGNSKN